MRVRLTVKKNRRARKPAGLLNQTKGDGSCALSRARLRDKDRGTRASLVATAFAAGKSREAPYVRRALS